MRIVSLVPSATETLFALGLDREIVGVSQDCDFPPEAKTKAIVVRSRLPQEATPAERERMTREYVGRGESLYRVDGELLAGLEPDLVLTQDLCSVCAATPDELQEALGYCSRRPEVLSLDPRDLADVWRDILWIGERTGRRSGAEAHLESIGKRLGQIESEVQIESEPRRVVLLEWLEPFYVGGHWVPEMVECAGGLDVLGRVRRPAYRVTEEEIIAAKPEVIFVAPCGHGAEAARQEYLSHTFSAAWADVPAVRKGQVFALDANSYVSRPAGRLVTGIEAMAKALHPSLVVRPKAEWALLPVPTDRAGQRSASAGSGSL